MARSVLSDDSESIQFPDSDALKSPSSAISIIALVKPATFDGNGNSGVVFKGVSAFAPSYTIRRSSEGDRLYNAVLNVGGAQATADTSEVEVAYHPMVLLWTSGEAIELRVYNMSGTLLQTVTSAGTVSGTISQGEQPLYIGQDNFGFWTGEVEHVRVYDVKLSDAQIADKILSGADDTDAVLHAPLDAGLDPEPDVSGNGGSGSLNGTPEFVTGPELEEEEDEEEEEVAAQVAPASRRPSRRGGMRRRLR